MSDQKSGTRRSAVDSEQKNTDQRFIRRRSSQRSVIKPKNKLSSILEEITKEDEHSINTNTTILSVYSGNKISLDNSLKGRINSLLKTETPYCDIIQRIEEGTSEVLVGDLKYKMRGTMLVAHHKDQSGKNEYWRVVMPENSETHRLVIAELHEIPLWPIQELAELLVKSEIHFIGRVWPVISGNLQKPAPFANWRKQVIL